MAKKNEQERVYVHPDFKHALKLEAAKCRTSVLKLTKRIAKNAKEEMEIKL